MTMTEQQYMYAQERKTNKALDAIRQAHHTDIPERFGHMRRYYRICEGSMRLRRAYTRQLQQQQTH